MKKIHKSITKDADKCDGKRPILFLMLCCIGCECNCSVPIDVEGKFV